MVSRTAPLLQQAIPFGDEFLGFPSSRGDGMLHRSAAVNRLFYTRDFAKAQEIVTVLSSEGVGAMRERAAKDGALNAVWDEMSRMGFFSDLAGTAPYSLAWRVDDQSSVDNQVRSYGMAFAAFAQRSPLFHAFVQNAIAIAPLCGAIEQATEKATLASDEKAGKAVPAIRVFSSLLGEESAAAELVDLLDSGKATLSFVTSVADKAGPQPLMHRLEAEGFLPAFRVTIGADTILDAAQRQLAVKTISRWLGEQPNREVDLHLSQPATFHTPQHLEDYFDSVELFIDLLLAMDDDVSRVSVVQQVAACVLHSRSLYYLLQARTVGGVLRLYRYFEDDLVATVPSGGKSLYEFHSHFCDTFLSNACAEECIDCPYHRFCPESLAQALLAKTDVQERTTLFRRRCRIWKKILGWLLDELLQICRDNADSAVPLLLKVREDQSVAFSPISPHREVTKA